MWGGVAFLPISFSGLILLEIHLTASYFTFILNSSKLRNK